ncbi:MAG: non-ribosomal peptide synthetase, partial [bacterium]|nr:non-ribosomal peptide synthetase [bacterium]
ETGINRIYPLSPMQKGMHFHHVAEKNSNAYFEQTHFTISGELDVAHFKESFKQLTRRYDILRTVFIHEGLEEPLQLVLEPCDKGEAGKNQVRFVYDDISHIKEKSQKQAYLETLRQKDKEEGFDLSGEMPIRLAVVKTGEQSHHILWSFYHIIMDGWCLGIIFKDLLQIYRSLKEATPLRLGQVTAYGNYIQWLEKQDSGEALEYWREYLAGYEQIAGLPGAKRSDLTYQLNEEYRQAALEWEIGTQKTAQLYKRAQQNGTTLNQVMQTIWALLLMQYNNSRDVVFGAVVSGRPAEIAGIEDMVGLFINTVPVRVTANDNQKFNRLLKTRHNENAKAKAYEYQSLAEIQANTPLQGRLFDHIMVFENYPVSEEMKQSTREQGFPFQIESPETREQTNYSFNIIIAPGKT